MAVTVVPTEGRLDEPEPPREAPAASPLAALRQRVSEARAARYEDIPVPGLEQIVVRYGPVSSSDLAEISKHRRKEPLETKGLLTSADILARACLGIYERDASGELQTDGELLSTEDGEALTFGTLRLRPDGKVVEQVRALYVADGDIVSVSTKVLNLSGFGDRTIDEDILGE